MTAHSVHIPWEELVLRRTRCLDQLARFEPEAGGLLVFSRVNIYYLTGVMCSGVFWLPREGGGLLVLRKGLERARLDSPESDAASFRSYGDLAKVAADHGRPLPGVVAAERGGLPWNLADNLQKRLPGVRFVDGDQSLARARALKTPWELERLREAGRRHARCLEELLPIAVSPGMTEMEIAHTLSDIYLRQGSCGISRMSAFGEEMLLGEISVGDNGNYPSFYNGPLGCRGFHPSAPFMGNPDTVWTEASLLTIDTGFCYEGYNSDKTVCYFAGRPEDIPARARGAHALCCDIERAVTDGLRPGALPSELYALSLDMAAKAGFAEGFMGLGGNQVPFLGHGIGLCIDEWPVFARRFSEPLQEGMVMAVEPKVGLPGFGMVGTENTWEITSDGARCLSGNILDILSVD